jgi:hypothetical protein
MLSMLLAGEQASGGEGAAFEFGRGSQVERAFGGDGDEKCVMICRQ